MEVRGDVRGFAGGTKKRTLAELRHKRKECEDVAVSFVEQLLVWDPKGRPSAEAVAEWEYCNIWRTEKASRALKQWRQWAKGNAETRSEVAAAQASSTPAQCCAMA